VSQLLKESCENETRNHFRLICSSKTLLYTLDKPVTITVDLRGEEANNSLSRHLLTIPS